ncbi:MAG: hypothetical protein M3Q05_12065, partial [Bacteroidota bacterium]|nr:hypothetical protein [Bacteroidota bacterium]
MAQRSEPRFAKPPERAKRGLPAMRLTGYCSPALAPKPGGLIRLQRKKIIQLSNRIRPVKAREVA